MKIKLPKKKTELNIKEWHKIFSWSPRTIEGHFVWLETIWCYEYHDFKGRYESIYRLC